MRFDRPKEWWMKKSAAETGEATTGVPKHPLVQGNPKNDHEKAVKALEDAYLAAVQVGALLLEKARAVHANDWLLNSLAANRVRDAEANLHAHIGLSNETLRNYLEEIAGPKLNNVFLAE
jgi:hypothetical protein